MEGARARPCTACGQMAAALRPAQVFCGPGDLRAGDVCAECAALGILLVMGPDAFDVPEQPPARAEKREPKDKSGPKRRARDSEPHVPLPLPKSSRESVLWKPGLAEELLRRRDDAAAVARNKAFTGAMPSNVLKTRPAPPPVVQEGWDPVEEEQYQKWKARLVAELREEAPALLRVMATESELEVTVERRTIEADGSSLKGRAARLVAEGFFASSKKQTAVRNELKRTGPDVNNGNLHRTLKELVGLGFLTDESDGYRGVPGAHVRIREAR